MANRPKSLRRQPTLDLMGLYQRWIHRKERFLTLQDTDRRVFPFEWGLGWLPWSPKRNGEAPDTFFEHQAARYVRDSDNFFQPPPTSDWTLEDDRLRFPSPAPGPDRFNNVTSARVFEALPKRRAVVVVPQWNADAESHVGLCRLIQRLGITAVRLSLPYHEERRPPGMRRADFMVSPNLGRTLQATRQGVLEVRQLVRWLRLEGYSRVGVMGTSIGSCVSYLAFVHDPEIRTGVFNHVSGYFADVVWTGLSTRFVRWGLEGHIELPTLRRCWAPVSPLSYVERLERQGSRKHLLITARYDLTFLPELSREVLREYRRRQLPVDSVSLPCGHYTTARFPFNWLDGWHICNYLYRNL